MLRDMTLADIDAVLCIEQSVQAYPWSRGNFIDALNAGYVCCVDELNLDGSLENATDLPLFERGTEGDLGVNVAIKSPLPPLLQREECSVIAPFNSNESAGLSDKICSYAVLMMGVEEAELLTIGVAASQQRRGLGRSMLNGMLAMAQDKNRQRVFLEVRASNVAAIALYRKVGFGEVGLRRGYYQNKNGGEDATVMAFDLVNQKNE